MNRREREWEAQRAAAALEAAEAGTDWHKANPEATLVEAWWKAHSIYGSQPGAQHRVFAFYFAVRSAREQRDEYLKEARA